MTVRELASTLGLTPICESDTDREVRGAYVGDLLSWVMGRASADNVWITIMSNLNVIAVSSLADVSCVILAEGVTLDEEVRETATAKGVNVYSSPLPIYETALKLKDLV